MRETKTSIYSINILVEIDKKDFDFIEKYSDKYWENLIKNWLSPMRITVIQVTQRVDNLFLVETIFDGIDHNNMVSYDDILVIVETMKDTIIHSVRKYKKELKLLNK